jgi:hypothetical protein
MYLRISRAVFDPAAYNQIAPLSREVATAMGRLPGLQHLHQGLDRTTGTAAVVSVWDSEEHARFDRDALGEVIDRLGALRVQMVEPEIYELEDAGAGG